MCCIHRDSSNDSLPLRDAAALLTELLLTRLLLLLLTEPLLAKLLLTRLLLTRMLMLWLLVLLRGLPCIPCNIEAYEQSTLSFNHLQLRQQEQKGAKGCPLR